MYMFEIKELNTEFVFHSEYGQYRPILLRAVGCVLQKNKQILFLEPYEVYKRPFWEACEIFKDQIRCYIYLPLCYKMLTN